MDFYSAAALFVLGILRCFKYDSSQFAASMSETQQSGLPHPVITEDECKGCGRCVSACPKKALKMSSKVNKKGFIHAEYTGEGCTGCAICYYNCPEPYAIEVHTEKKVTK
jgi:2-oxoisovalerate ferredoxin oxidoreductase delta subunit